ncbi:MAG: hypothetical protein Q8Q80_03050 [Methyloversatilis sp.]|uniref:hypothetical protein n=1 Tax=Methyloversatilis sp. TaxID=2569862 RepID=UPI0027352F8F|nr:hypothetical protein [Methyloversatilis sp.]MDP3871616.1 hypothetical protein [Methyloversatilis sp.]
MLSGPPGLAGAAGPGTDPALAAASPEVRRTVLGIKESQDNAGAPFHVIDKKQARLFAFDADGRLLGTTAVLLGAAIGDHSVPGIGNRPMGQIRPEERTTPAGRFVSEQGTNLKGEDVTWVDYDNAVSLHRVRTGKPAERRLERLATATPDDNRISYGCINVPGAFYDRHIRPGPQSLKPAVIYVLPETGSATNAFAPGN